MSTSAKSESGAPAYPDPSLHSEGYYRHLFRRNVVRLVFTYLAPLLVLSVYFTVQYRQILLEGRNAHLMAVAENQANTLDLFLRERIVNLSNLIDDPKLPMPPSRPVLGELLVKLKESSDAFTDIGFFNSQGIQEAYAGPYPQLENQDYSHEPWFTALKRSSEDYVVTDSYLGLRNKPHFTIAVRRVIDGQYVVLRSAIEPERLMNWLKVRDETGSVTTSLVNRNGVFQLVSSGYGEALETSPIVPPRAPVRSTGTTELNGDTVYFAYDWLQTSDWALIVRWIDTTGDGNSTNTLINVMAFSAAIMLLILATIIVRARQIVEQIQKADRTRAELSDNLLHASKLAAVGELASGIAHEINNPLAIISEEVGLIKDFLDPEFGIQKTPEEIIPNLDTIQQAVFRCRDITRKLLAFVRRDRMQLQVHAVQDVLDGMVALFAEQLRVSNIEVDKTYCPENLQVMIDKNQVQQVFVNLMTNAIDALGGRGRISLKVEKVGRQAKISFSDNGCGMTQEVVDKIFLPFFTTKDVGRGTGLGLSISYGIIKSLGGSISVSSTVGEGTTFLIELPLHEPTTG